jgi:hypothetical protein
VAEAKTKPTTLSARSYLNAIEDPARKADCETIAALMQRVTGCPPVMWGTSIVGFDRYHYRYESGHEGDSCVVGFSSRKGDISIYLMAGYEEAETKALLAKLGKHKCGKACLYVKRMSDVDESVLEALVAKSVAATRKRYPDRDSHPEVLSPSS